MNNSEQLEERLLDENGCSSLKELQDLCCDDSYAHRVAIMVLDFLIDSKAEQTEEAIVHRVHHDEDLLEAIVQGNGQPFDNVQITHLKTERRLQND